MKTAISIPDAVFEAAERLARRMKRSRSDMYSQAVAEFVARHSPDRVTEAMNEALAGIDSAPDEFTREASRRAVVRSDW
jgi:Ribbon-helix-helix protein, copG family.